MQPNHIRICGKLFVAIGLLIIALTAIVFNFIDVMEAFFSVNFENWKYDFGIFTLTKPPFGLLYIIPLIYFAIALINIVVGIGLLQFKKWARTSALALAVLYLFAPLLGTIFGVYILYHLIDSEWFNKEAIVDSATHK
jgi:hypothetical protein